MAAVGRIRGTYDALSFEVPTASLGRTVGHPYIAVNGVAGSYSYLASTLTKVACIALMSVIIGDSGRIQ
jgi:hypothetical protein